MLAAALNLPEPPARIPGGGRLLTGPSYAWLTGRGVQAQGAFCTIPTIRGGLKSLTADDIADEARALLAQGVRA